MGCRDESRARLYLSGLEHQRETQTENQNPSKRESATQPSSWDAEDIRSTWIQNVGDGS